MTQVALVQAPVFSRSRWVSLAIGVLAMLGITIPLAFHESRRDFFSAYLFAYMFWLGVTLGGLTIVMIHNLTGGKWGQLVRRIGQAAGLMAPLMLVLFIPILFGMHELFPWTHADELAKEAVLRHREPYLNLPFFFGRAALYLLLWVALAFIIRFLGRRVEETGRESTRSALRGWSAAGLIIYLMTMTNAGYDWAASRDVEFYSTAFGFVLTTGQAIAGMSFCILVMALLMRTVRDPDLLFAGISPYERPPVNPPEASAPNVLNDVGNLLLVMVILWTYVSFMQFLVIWMGNTREDNGYFLARGLGQPSPWRWVGLALIVFHFFVPFFLLLFRGIKKRLGPLVGVAAVLFVMHFVEQYWIVAPNPEYKGPHWHVTWVDCIAPVAVGGLWLACFFWVLPFQLPWGPVSREEMGTHAE